VTNEPVTPNKIKDNTVGRLICIFYMLTKLQKAYIAGFLDGDGCVMFQIVRRKDYIFGYQIRASIVFYQKTIHKDILIWLKSKLIYGYIRDRKDDMTEYTIVGKNHVIEVLKHLKPYLRLKIGHAKVAFEIAKVWPKKFDQDSLLAVGKLVDKFQHLNYSKKRKNTSLILNKFFADNVPVTTDSRFNRDEIGGT
jgi:intein-encoded DNA endonuclease-like protein